MAHPRVCHHSYCKASWCFVKSETAQFISRCALFLLGCKLLGGNSSGLHAIMIRLQFSITWKVYLLLQSLWANVGSEVSDEGDLRHSHYMVNILTGWLTIPSTHMVLTAMTASVNHREHMRNYARDLCLRKLNGAA
jgi:hypothetical protein